MKKKKKKRHDVKQVRNTSQRLEHCKRIGAINHCCTAPRGHPEVWRGVWRGPQMAALKANGPKGPSGSIGSRELRHGRR